MASNNGSNEYERREPGPGPASFFENSAHEETNFLEKLLFLENSYWENLLGTLGSKEMVFATEGQAVFHFITQNDMSLLKLYFSNPEAAVEFKEGDTVVSLLAFACYTKHGNGERHSPDKLRKRLQIVDYLIEKGADVNGPCSVYLPSIGSAATVSPLFIAVHQENMPLVKLLLEKRAIPSAEIFPLKVTPLHQAAFCCVVPDFCEILLKYGADLNQRDTEGTTPLMVACLFGRVLPFFSGSSFLLNKHADIHVRNRRNLTALHNAALGSDVKIIKLLLRKGADVNAESSEGYTPLDIAIIANRENSVLRLFTDKQGKSNIILKRKQRKSPQAYLIGRYGKVSPLHDAASKNYIDDIKYLLNHGNGDTNVKDDLGSTPLCYAVLENARGAVELLIQAGADVNIESNTKSTALHLAVLLGLEEISCSLLNSGAKTDNFQSCGPLLVAAAQVQRYSIPAAEVEATKKKKGSIANQLILKGAPLDKTCPKNRTPRDTAVLFSNEPVAKIIDLHFKIFQCVQHGLVAELKKCVSNGAFVDCRSVKFKTPLQYAVLKNRLDVVSCLIELGANVNYAPDGKVTALHYAAKMNRPEIALKLLLSGAAFDARTARSGKTPLDVCLEEDSLGQSETARLLKFVQLAFKLNNQMFTQSDLKILLSSARNAEGMTIESASRVTKSNN